MYRGRTWRCGSIWYVCRSPTIPHHVHRKIPLVLGLETIIYRVQQTYVHVHDPQIDHDSLYPSCGERRECCVQSYEYDVHDPLVYTSHRSMDIEPPFATTQNKTIEPAPARLSWSTQIKLLPTSMLKSRLASSSLHMVIILDADNDIAIAFSHPPVPSFTAHDLLNLQYVMPTGSSCSLDCPGLLFSEPHLAKCQVQESSSDRTVQDFIMMCSLPEDDQRHNSPQTPLPEPTSSCESNLSSPHDQLFVACSHRAGSSGSGEESPPIARVV